MLSPAVPNIREASPDELRSSITERYSGKGEFLLSEAVEEYHRRAEELAALERAVAVLDDPELGLVAELERERDAAKQLAVNVAERLGNAVGGLEEIAKMTRTNAWRLRDAPVIAQATLDEVVNDGP
jgi:hypothetical protein